MKTHKVLALFLSCLISFQASQAQTPSQTKSQTPVSTAGEDARVERLARLAKVWGAVKYFHPYLAYRDIDWDKALVETLPKVNSARTPQEYEAAVNQMLAVLNDRSTRAEIEGEGKREIAGSSFKTDEKTNRTDQKNAQENARENAREREYVKNAQEYVRKENGVVVIDAAGIGTAVATDTSTLSKFVTKVTEALPDATGIVIDARGRGGISDLHLYYFGVFVQRILTSMLDLNVVLGSMRYLLHNG